MVLEITKTINTSKKVKNKHMDENYNHFRIKGRTELDI